MSADNNISRKNKNFYHDKDREVFVCVCHNTDFSTLKECFKHCKAVKRERGEESAYDRHYRSCCGKNSRICRYCHQELEIGSIDVKASNAYPGPKEGDVHTIITTLLALEHRYRNKFSEEHLEDINRAIKRGTLEKMVRSRMEKRLRAMSKRDGYQTPYTAHGIDVGSHTCATCCRGCLSRRYKIPKNRDLTDEEIDFLVDTLVTYLVEYIHTPGPVREFMTERPPNEQGYFYEPGEYIITKESVKKVADTTIVPKTHWYTFKQKAIKEFGEDVDFSKLLA